MKIIASWDVMLCILVDKYQHFEGKCCLHLQGSLDVKARFSEILHDVTSQKTVTFMVTILIS
jgi:hypothetical protein